MTRHPANKAKAPFVKPSIRTGGTLAKLLAVVQLERVLRRSDANLVVAIISNLNSTAPGAAEGPRPR